MDVLFTLDGSTNGFSGGVAAMGSVREELRQSAKTPPILAFLSTGAFNRPKSLTVPQRLLAYYQSVLKRCGTLKDPWAPLKISVAS